MMTHVKYVQEHRHNMRGVGGTGGVVELENGRLLLVSQGHERPVILLMLIVTARAVVRSWIRCTGKAEGWIHG